MKQKKFGEYIITRTSLLLTAYTEGMLVEFDGSPKSDEPVKEIALAILKEAAKYTDSIKEAIEAVKANS